MLPQEPTTPVEKDPTQLPHAPNQNDVPQIGKLTVVRAGPSRSSV